MADVGRRAFITLIGGGAAAAWTSVARAQQPGKPVIGFLDPRSPEAMTDRLRGFRRGLKDTGYVEDENVTIVDRWAENHVDRLPALAADLVRRKVTLIVASGGPGVAFAAKAATSTIPTLFLTAEDPVRLGLVASLARPAGNLTGINFLNRELASKQLELLRELVPGATRFVALVDPANAEITETTVRDVKQAATAIGLQMQFLNASTSQEIDAVFATLARERPDALFVSPDAFFTSRRVQITTLAARGRIPAASGPREFVEVGGLMSYGTDRADRFRQAGVYTGKILDGAKPADLPVQQATKFVFAINLKTAKALGLTIPETLLATADEVIQ